MNCPKCAAWSSIKETRGPRRRRECANGHRFTTIEQLADEVKQSDAYEKTQEARATLRSKGYLQ